MNIVVGNANVTKLIQTGTLARMIGQQLYPALLYRGIAYREPWEGAVGQTMDFLVPGLFEVDTRPRQPGVAKPPRQLDYERYQATVEQYGEGADVHMPTNYVTSVSTYVQQMKALGLNAGQTMNRLARDELFRCYQWGNSIVDDVAGDPVITVSSLNGFRQTFDPNTGSPIPVPASGTTSPRCDGSRTSPCPPILATMCGIGPPSTPPRWWSCSSPSRLPKASHRPGGRRTYRAWAAC